MMDQVEKHFEVGDRQNRFDKHRKFGGLSGHTATRKTRGWHIRVDTLGNRRWAPKQHGVIASTGNRRWGPKVQLTAQFRDGKMFSGRQNNCRNGGKVCLEAAKPKTLPTWIEALDKYNMSHSYHENDDSHIVFEDNHLDELELINQELCILNQQILDSTLDSTTDDSDFMILSGKEDSDIDSFCQVFSIDKNEDEEWAFL